MFPHKEYGVTLTASKCAVSSPGTVWIFKNVREGVPCWDVKKASSMLRKRQ